MSSHREAPEISKDPVADNTDVYAFVSPDRPDTVTLIANFIPLQLPYGGPNFNEFGDDVRYAIHVSNAGDARADVTYQFRFTTVVRNKSTFLYNTGPIETLSDTDWNRPQFYSVTRVEHGGPFGGSRRTVLAQNVPTPPVNIGPRSTPNYGSLMGAAVTSLPGGGKVYAGQIDDPFYVDLGSVFDLAGLRPFNPAHNTIPHSAMDERKPVTPSAISALRPRLSDWRAQCGAVSTQSSADQLKARLTQTSGMCSLAPMAGRIDCIAVLPAAATSMTANSTAMRSEGMECDVVAMSALLCLPSVTLPLPTRGRLAVQSQDRLFPCATVTILPRL